MTDRPNLIKESHGEYGDYLDKCKPEDFDGHSNFASFTHQQRLEWLGRAVTVVRKFKGLAK